MKNNLHSNMDRLKLIPVIETRAMRGNLHSNMDRLKPAPARKR